MGSTIRHTQFETSSSDTVTTTMKLQDSVTNTNARLLCEFAYEILYMTT